MTCPRRLSPLFPALPLLFLLALLSGPRAIVLAQTPAPAAPRLEQLSELAQAGRFDQVLSALEADPRLTADARAAALIADLKLYQQHRQEQTGRRQQQLADEQAKLEKALASDKIDEAMVALLTAYTLTDDTNKLLTDASARDLIRRTQQLAVAAEKQSDWLEAMSLYRELDALYEAGSPYRSAVKLAERRVRLIRMYAPQEFKKLFVERAKRLQTTGKDDVPATQPSEPVLGSETWEQQLAGVNLATLHQALTLAARKHVSNGGYRPVLLGALTAVDALAQTPQLAQAFAGLKNEASLNQFKSTLAKLRQEVTQASALDSLDQARVVDQIVAANRATVDLPEAILAFEMADGAMSNLDDFTNVIWPREKEEIKRTTQGKFGGAGILIAQKRVGAQMRLMVVTPLRDSPALKVGLRAGDLIAAVNGRSTEGWSLDQAVRAITGPEGTDVTLTIERSESADPLSFTLQRAIINIESIKGWQLKSDNDWDYYIDPQARIGYVRLTQFIPQTADDLDDALNAMETGPGLNALILDLRYNPGGLLPSAIQVANRFIPEGKIVDTVDGEGQVHEEARARPERAHPRYPVIVLVNEGSASASEIVSGALQDHGRAMILGTRSYGKGSVQDLYPLDGGRSYLKLTTQYYRLPKGRILHRQPDSKTWGVEPDVVVKVTPLQLETAGKFRQDVDIVRAGNVPTTQPAPTAGEILTQGMDPQLETALLILKTRLVAQTITVAQRHDAPSPVR